MQIKDAIRATFEDHNMSRSESKALAALFGDAVRRKEDIARLRSMIFEVAGEQVKAQGTRRTLAWLEAAVRVLERTPPPSSLLCEAVFSPGPTCSERLAELLSQARHRVDICVFTITDDRISRAIIAAQCRGIQLRIISDDHKASDLGSDISKFVAAGIAVVTDSSPAHMHHKFAIFDREIVVSGSYNWTRSASEENQENLVICNHTELVKQFQEEFERLWARFGSRDA